MPIRLTDDKIIELADYNCSYRIDYTYSKNVIALQRVLNITLKYAKNVFNWFNSVAAISEDGIYGNKTKALQKLLFGDQYTNPCNLTDILHYAKPYGYVTDNFIRSTAGYFLSEKQHEPTVPPVVINTDIIPLGEGSKKNSSILVPAIILLFLFKFLK